MNLKAGSFVRSFAPSPLRDFLTTTTSADFSSFVVTALSLRAVLHLDSTSMRPPRRRCDNFPPVQPSDLLLRHFGNLDFMLFWTLIHTNSLISASMFVGPGFCPQVFSLHPASFRCHLAVTSLPSASALLSVATTAQRTFTA